MICFSDLDRTIICSKKLINEDKSAICIELKNEEEISYVNNAIIDKLSKVISKYMFIPVTTRSLEQFNRIRFDNHGIGFRYAIVSNGATILKNGKPLDSWSRVVSEVKLKSGDMGTLINKFNEHYYKNIANKIKMLRVVEDNFFYVVLNENFECISFLDDFIDYIESQNWVCFKNCSKVYFLPKGISKEAAIEFLLKNELGNQDFIALGDSNMDKGMLSIANRAYIPKHGDLAKNFKHKSLYITKTKGLDAIVEMLDDIINTN